MREITSRVYQVSRLDDAQVDVLHEQENSAGFHLTPWLIKKRFRLNDIGDVQELSYEKTESQVVAIYEKTRAEYRRVHSGCCFKDADGLYPKADGACKQNADLVILHQADWKIRDDQFISIITPTSGGKAKQKIRDGAFSGESF